jgi:hypothetical protein
MFGPPGFGYFRARPDSASALRARRRRAAPRARGGGYAAVAWGWRGVCRLREVPGFRYTGHRPAPVTPRVRATRAARVVRGACGGSFRVRRRGSGRPRARAALAGAPRPAFCVIR